MALLQNACTEYLGVVVVIMCVCGHTGLHSQGHDSDRAPAIAAVAVEVVDGLGIVIESAACQVRVRCLVRCVDVELDANPGEPTSGKRVGWSMVRSRQTVTVTRHVVELGVEVERR